MRGLFTAMLLIAACTGPSGGPPVETDVDSDSDTGTPIDGEWIDQWSYEPVDGMVCGGGAPTGIGISEGTDPDKLVVYLVGGGACWDAVSCFVLEAAENLEAVWDEDDLRAELAPIEASGLLDRGDSDSPVHDATWVYVPYCTGDLQLGQSVRVHDPTFQPDRMTHHVGNTNLTHVLERLQADQPGLSELWVVGSSAGGYAAQMQAHRFRSTWPSATLRVFADGAPMVQPGEGRWGQWQNAWDAQLPPGCTDCTTSMPAVLARQADAMPEVSFALATTTEDLVITLFLAQPLFGLNAAQSALIADQYGPDHMGVFRVEGSEHLLLGAPDNVVASDGTVLRDWFEDWARGEVLEDHF